MEWSEFLHVVYRISMAAEIIFILAFLPLKKRMLQILLTIEEIWFLTAVLEYVMFKYYFYHNQVCGALITLLEEVVLQVGAQSLSIYNDWRTVFTTFAASNFVLVGNVDAIIIYSVTGEAVIAIVAGILIHTLVLILLVILLREDFLQEMAYRKNSWLSICLIPILFYAVIYSMVQWPGRITQDPKVAVTSVLVLLLMLKVYHFVTSGWKKVRMETERVKQGETMERLGQELLREAEEIAEGQKALAVERHDLRHYYRLMHSYLDNGQYEEAHDMIARMEERLDQRKKEAHYCENVVVNGILGIYAGRAENQGVSFQCRADVPEDTQETKNLEFIAMLSNLLENALRVAEKCKKEKKMEVYIVPRKEQIIFEIKNSSEKKIEISPKTGLPVTESRQGHGYGLLSVSNYAKDHGAILRFSQENDMVTVRYISNM